MAMNYVAVLVAAIAAFVVGSLWHGPLFGKLWMKLSGINMKSMKKGGMTATKAMVLGFIATVVASYVVSYFVDVLGITSLSASTQFAFWAWLGLSAPITIGGYLWEGKSLKLALLNTAYRLVELIVIAGVLAVWP